MKKLKKFQKFALSAEQASMVKGGITCHANGGTAEFIDADAALKWCQGEPSCDGCF